MEEWYLSQEFFSMERYEKIKEHIKSESSLTKLYRYGSRRNNAS
jgi:hypothetical protein